MSKRFNIKDELEKLYIEIPKALLFEPKYKPNKEKSKKGLSNDAKVLYGILLDRTYLSIHTATEKGDTTYVDENGDIFMYFELASIEEILNVGTKKAIATKKELISFGLLEEVRAGQGKDNRLYLNIVETNKDNLKLYTSNFLSKVKEKKKSEEIRISNLRKNKKSQGIGNTLYCKKDSTSTAKKTVLVLSKNQISNTEKSNTEYSMYVCSDKSQLKKSKLIEITKKHLCLSSNSEKELVKFDSKIDFDLFEKVLMKIINNNKVNDKESYLMQTISNLIDKNILTLDQYTKSIEEYNKKYIDKKQSNLNSNNKTKNIKPRTTQHAINQTYKKYNADELENMLLNNQKSKFDNSNRLTKKSINEKLANDNSSDQEEFEWDY
ncbi:replication initiation protein Tn1549-like, CTn2-Orf2,Replication initiator protein A (RepA) N-terminus [[Clostridium] sordellii]|uniref:replication initiator protein A n=1 Tax=Paraclostridium sordellii TaxID=1505 RepID=UPI0005436972|nr:replication initiator protein A [Paeniclostridium sordellii]CEK36488.1 replication initiation protein Tn1549-like, CTn2-Orf2,Replication initiator protein A (RepA) N-terminus [[Clostridium] sordellii] [Paeniclostridium sordellii]